MSESGELSKKLMATHIPTSVQLLQSPVSCVPVRMDQTIRFQNLVKNTKVWRRHFAVHLVHLSKLTGHRMRLLQSISMLAMLGDFHLEHRTAVGDRTLI